jgi:hypothetical protein
MLSDRIARRRCTGVDRALCFDEMDRAHENFICALRDGTMHYLVEDLRQTYFDARRAYTRAKYYDDQHRTRLKNFLETAHENRTYMRYVLNSIGL